MRLPIKIAAAMMLFGAALSWSFGGPIAGPAEFKRDTVAAFDVKAKGMLNVEVPPGLSIQKTGDKWFLAGKPGTYTISGHDYWVDFDKKTFGLEPVTVTFKILTGDVDPAPVPPVPPGPGPAPVPPTPEPSVRTNPFSDDAGRVLIQWDPLGPPLTAAQTSVLYGQAARDAMKAFAPNDGVRIWPKGQATKDPVWGSALQRLPKSYPWLLVGKGSKGYEGPLTDDLIAKLKELTPVAVPDAPPVRADLTPVAAPVSAPVCRQVWNGRQWVTVCQ